MTERTLATVARALEARADQPGVFSGYASLFEIADSQGDMVERGAFRASLEAWRTKGRRPAMLWQHDPNEPIGLWTHLEEDAAGLRVEGRLLLSVQAGAEAHEHLKMGTVSGLSIGFQAIEARRDRKTGIRRLVRVNLWEISLVTFPANHGARVAAVKADDDRLARALDRVAATRPILAFDRKALTPFEEANGRRQPRDGRGLWTRVAGPGAGPSPKADPDDELPKNIDWAFITRREGKELAPYTLSVNGKSGVTIGTGVDLGQRNIEDMRRLKFDDEAMKDGIIEKVRPALGLKGKAAERAKTLIRLSPEEIDALDRAVKRDVFERIRDRYDRETHQGSFDSLPPAARTVILSVAYHAGPNFAAPKFWGAVTARRWDEAVKELRDWSKLPGMGWLNDRRRIEGNYLERGLRGF